MDYISILLAALWLGLLTSVSPCPLATNIAAVSFLSRRMDSRRLAVAGALVYAFGRAIVYVAIGLILMMGLVAAPRISSILQTAILPFIGPILILVGLVLLDWLPLPVSFGFSNPAAASRLSRLGLLGDLVLGMLFALSFCPVSAALFFGTLLPMGLASAHPSPVFALYGLGTATPVGILSVAVVLGFTHNGPMMEGIRRWQPKLRTLTAVVILFIGVWLTARGIGLV